MEWLLTLAGSFAGAALGVPAGFWVNHLWSKHQSGQDTVQLSEALRATIQGNIELLDKLTAMVAAGGVPFFNLDLTVMDATATLKYKTLDTSVAQEVDRLRYDLSRIARNVDLYVSLYYDTLAMVAQTEGKTIYSFKSPDLIAGILSHAEPIKESARAVLSQLNTRVNGVAPNNSFKPKPLRGSA